VRILDTRPGVPTGFTGSKPTASTTVELQVTGRVGVPSDAQTVVLNVTGTDSTAAGYVTVWPCGETRPNASNLNLGTKDTAANMAIVKVGAGGKVCLFTERGTHLIADLAGFLRSGAAFTSMQPTRLIDTRPGAARINFAGSKPAPGATLELPVTGTNGVPTEANAVVLNITGTGATSAGYVTVWPCGQSRPNASNINLDTGGTRPNLVVAKVGTDGKVCIFTERGTDLIADLSGWIA
jgi:hypothetical protein